MKRPFTLAILASCALLLHPASAHALPTQIHSQTNNNEAIMSNEFCYVKLSVDTTSSPFTCNLRIDIQNRGKDPLVVFKCEGIIFGKLKIIDSKGAPCPYTPLGKNIIHLSAGSTRTEKILEGESEEFSLPLHKLFKFQEGEWTLEYVIKILRKDELYDISGAKVKFPISPYQNLSH